MDRLREGLGRRATPRALTGLLLAAVALFSVNEVLAQRAQTATLAHLRTIIEDAAPSVIQLVEMRRAARELKNDLFEACDDGLEQRPRHERHGRELFSQIDEHLQAYLRLPAASNERPTRAELEPAIAGMVRARDAVFAATDREAARQAFHDDFAPRADHVAQIAATLVELNAVEASKAALDADSQQQLAQERSFVLLTVLSIALVAVGLTVHRTVARAQEETDRRLEELDAFAARVAHDLRGPLSPVSVAIGLLQRNETITDGQKRALAAAERSVARMVALIEGLLRFARAAARPEPGARSFVERVVAEQLVQLAPLAVEERAELSQEVEPGLEAAAVPAVLGSILENLVRNALLHMGESQTRHVLVRARGQGSWVVLEVVDTGPGIPADVARRLFRPFERGSDRPGGHGLGLAIVKRLAEAHGGTASLRSAVGEGSTFEVRLPRFGVSIS